MLAGRVHPSLLLGVELPPVPVDAGSGEAVVPAGLVPWWEAARAAAAAGAGVVWFRGATGGAGASCDACTIAAAAVDHVPGVHLGVVSSVPLERHPAVLAREVTALDHVSDGRAAVLLHWASPDRPSGLVEASEQLAEAVAVCGAVLRDEKPRFEGRHYHVAGAVNRPRPRQAGGPPVFSDAPTGPAALAAAHDATGPGPLRRVLQVASAVVCADDPAQVAEWRSAIEEAGTRSRGTREEPARPALVCRTTMREPPSAARGGAAAGSAGIDERLRAARDAGADGVVVRIPWVRRADTVRGGKPATGDAGAGEPHDLRRALETRLAPWAR